MNPKKLLYPFTFVSPLAVFIVPALLMLVLIGCANLNPVAIAETPEQKYNAAKLAYDALLTPAVEIIEDANAPVELRRTLQSAVAASGQIYRAGDQVYIQFRAARAAVAAGTSPAERLEIATANLEGWAAQLDDALDDIAGALP